MKIFVSYARQDAATIREIRDALTRLGHEVWMDRELRGGQQWWDVILERIRSCDVFMFALSPDSAKSKACPSEIAYAVDTDRPLMPVMVRAADVRVFPKAISDIQFVDYTAGDVNSVVDLISALGRLRSSVELPTPLPPPPPAPGIVFESALSKLSAESLTFKEQASLLTEIRASTGDEEDTPVVMQLLNEFRRRPDIAEAIGRDIDRLLRELGPAGAAPPSDAAAAENEATADDGTRGAQPSPETPSVVANVDEGAPQVKPDAGAPVQEHRFVAPGVDLHALAGRLQNFFTAEKMESQVVEDSGAVLVQGRSGGKFGRAVGAGVAFSVRMMVEGEELVVELGQMEWADKGAAAAVGLLVFWPAIIPAIIGGAKQKALPNKALRVIEAAIPDVTSP